MATGMATPPSSLTYRPDIDGLRAIAVLSVLLFHLDAEWVPGGFVGVDVFFVISGYLITSIIARHALAGTFSFGDFYRRRILRIAPVYVAVTLATLLAGAVLMVPEDFASLARSAAWSAFSLPNVYFWKYLDTSYFAADTNQVPLLHLWSLGVEEQFYLLWPALLLLLLRWAGRRMYLAPMAILAALSFAWAHQWAIDDFPFAYYMLPARAGELLVGAILALILQGSAGARMLPRWASEALALIGYALIGWALFCLDRESRFPGINALWPCLGAAALILAGRHRDCVMIRPLTLKPMVAIGLISYSLYLWHWPILAFFRYFAVEIEPREKWVLIALILAVSVASYRFIERPFRTGTALRFPKGKLFARYAAVTMALAIVGQVGFETDGFVEAPWNKRYREASAAMVERTKAAYSFKYNCQSSKFSARVFGDERCVFGARGGRDVDVILVGDSNAAHYVGMLRELSRAHGFAFRNATLSSCPPVFSPEQIYGARARRNECTAYRKAISTQVDPYGVVILGAQWTNHKRTPEFKRDFEATVRELVRRRKRVVVLGMVPRFQSYGVGCEMRRLRLPVVDCRQRAESRAFVDRTTNAYLRRLADRYPTVEYMDVVPVLCPGGRCSPYLDGKPVYFDPGHLSMVGSTDIGRKMVQSKMRLPDVLEHLPRYAPELGRSAVVARAGPQVVSLRKGALAEPLPGALRLPFRHAVRWDKRQRLGGGALERSVDLEIIGVDPDSAMRGIHAQLMESGYQAGAPAERRGGVARAYRHPDGRRINAVYWRRPMKGAVPGATGRLTMGWVGAASQPSTGAATAAAQD